MKLERTMQMEKPQKPCELEKLIRTHVQLYYDLVKGSVRPAEAKERSNAFGKIVKGVEVIVGTIEILKKYPDLEIPLVTD